MQGLYGNQTTSTGPLGSGSSIAVWAATVPPGLYDVAVTWTASASHSHHAVYVINDGNYSLLGFGYINQQVAPNQFTDQGVAWDRLGTFRLTTGNVLRVITFNDQPDGQVCADAVRITPVNAITVDDANLGSEDFATAGNWTTSSQGLYGGSHVSTGAAAAAAVLPPGPLPSSPEPPIRSP